MKTIRFTSLLALSLVSFLTPAANAAAVRLTALQIISTDSKGVINGVGGHRFKTSNHGGQPCLFVIQGDDPTKTIMNPTCPNGNQIDIPLSAGTYTYTLLAENANSYTWNDYSINLHFDNATTAQVSARAPLNSTSTLFFPPMVANTGDTETLVGYSVKAGGFTYTSGTTTVKLTDFHISNPNLYKIDRISPFEAKADKTNDYVAQITFEVTAPPEIAAGGVVNAASFSPKIAPGSLFSIFGNSLATTTQAAASVPLPTSMSGTTVTVGGKPAPIVYISGGQINAQVPYEVTAGTAAVVVTVNGVASPAVNATVVAAAPGIFQFGDKRAVVQNEDYSVNTDVNGAKAESYVVAYLTGAGAALDNPVATGAAAGSNPLSKSKTLVTASVNGVNVPVAFAGLTPSFVGLMQVNLKMPNLPAGNYPLVISLDGSNSNSAMVTIK